MSSIGQKIAAIKNELPPNVTLVAVSKTKPNEAILEAYQSGQKQFGENKVQELVAKYEALPKDIEWHLIGHLQSNKVKYIAPFVALIHAVDSLKLLKEIDKQAEKNNRVIDCLLQFHIAKEDTKFGLDMNEANELLSSHEYQSMKNIRVVGVMGMATFTENTEQIAHEFTQLKSIFDGLKNTFFKNQQTFKEVSMGMSGDYKIAVQCGSTMVRIGSTIFGER
jgi:PLP dependent protein